MRYNYFKRPFSRKVILVNESQMDSASLRASTGVSGLDDVLLGGLTRNRLYLLEGEPGTGKTTLGLHFLLEGVKRGERTLHITLSETREEINAVAHSHHWSLDPITILELVPSEANLAPDEQFTMYHPAETELGDTLRSIQDAVTRAEPSRVVIDSLSEFRLLAQNPLRYRRQVLALKQFFAGRRCTVILLDDSNSVDFQVRSIAHGVLTMQQLAPEFGADRRRLRVLKMRGRPFRGGYHDYVIATGGLEVYPRLIAAEHKTVFSSEKIVSGLKNLDRLLGGGLDRGTSTLVTGAAGTGKSTLVMQYVSAAAARGEVCAVFAFDESRGTLLARSEALGMKLQEHLDSGCLSIQQVDPAELSPGQLAYVIRARVERDNCRIVVIDSLNGYLNAMPEERFLTIQMHELLMYLSQRGVTTLLVAAQQGLVGAAIETPVEVSYLADCVILTRYFELGGRVKKAISVVKKRSGPHEDTIRELMIGRGGVQLGEPLDQLQGVLTGTPTFVGPRPVGTVSAGANGKKETKRTPA